MLSNCKHARMYCFYFQRLYKIVSDVFSFLQNRKELNIDEEKLRQVKEELTSAFSYYLPIGLIVWKRRLESLEFEEYTIRRAMKDG